MPPTPDQTGSAAIRRHELVGYFTDPSQTEPVYDPPHDAPCLVCWQPLTPENVRTISLMPAEGAVASVFFRVHRSCAEDDPGAVEEIEHRIIEGEFAAQEDEPAPSYPLCACGHPFAAAHEVDGRCAAGCDPALCATTEASRWDEGPCYICGAHVGPEEGWHREDYDDVQRHWCADHQPVWSRT